MANDGITIHGQLLLDSKLNTDKPLLDANYQNGESLDSFQSITEAQNNAADSYKNNTAIMKEFGDIMPEIIKNLRYMNSVVAQTSSSLPAIKKQLTSEEQKDKRLDQLNRQNFLGFINTGSNMIQGAAHGNISGSLISGASGMSSTMNNFSQMADVSGMSGLAKGLLVGGGLLTAGVAIAKGGKALADAYKDAMPTIFGTGKAFGTTDNDLSMALYKNVNTYNNGTNLDNDAFNSLVVGLRKQGIGNGLTSPFEQAAMAGKIAETTSQWAYATGGDANQYANLAGIMSRYGGSKNVPEDFNRIVSAGYASGLNDSQIPEFLSGIQKVMEEGIAKGFSRSATEVAETMMMFSKLSGNNAFWQGEQGAKIINQASAGLSSATSLSKTTDLIAFGALSRAKDKNGRALTESALKKGESGSLYMEDSNYVNEMMLLEQGLTKDNFGALMGGIYASTGNDGDAQIERIRQMFGLNYTGARRMQQLYEEYKDKPFDATFDTKLKNIQESPENQNDETAYRKSVNKIAEALQTLGQPVFNLEVKGLQTIETSVGNIERYLASSYQEKELAKRVEMMDSYKQAFLYSESLKDNGNFKNVTEAMNDKDFIDSLDSWNGVGAVPGFENNYLIKDIEGKNIDKAVERNYKKEGGIELNKTIGYGKNDMVDQNLYLRQIYGQDILNLVNGDMNLYNSLIDDYLTNYTLSKEDKNYSDVMNVRKGIKAETLNRFSVKGERDEVLGYIKIIAEKLKEGFVMQSSE